jgi:hypothetical protein
VTVVGQLHKPRTISLSSLQVSEIQIYSSIIKSATTTHSKNDWLDGLASISGRQDSIFIFATTSRPALGPTQNHIQWVQSGAVSRFKCVQLPELEDDRLLISVITKVICSFSPNVMSNKIREG